MCDMGVKNFGQESAAAKPPFDCLPRQALRTGYVGRRFCCDLAQRAVGAGTTRGEIVTAASFRT